MGVASEWHEVLEIGRRYGIGSQLQQGNEDMTPFHESITIFPTMCVRVGKNNIFFVEWPQKWKDPYQQSDPMDLPVASDHNFKFLHVQIDYWPQLCLH